MSEILSDEQIEIWIEFTEARQGGLPDSELRAVFQSYKDLRTRVEELEEAVNKAYRDGCTCDIMNGYYCGHNIRIAESLQPKASEDEEKIITNGYTD